MANRIQEWAAEDCRCSLFLNDCKQLHVPPKVVQKSKHIASLDIHVKRAILAKKKKKMTICRK